MTRMTLIGAVAAFGLAAAANAALTITGLGSAAPGTNPATAGMTPFALFDSAPVFADVTSVQGPFAGSIGFSSPMSHRNIGFGWATWSHGYTGSVYYSNGATSVTVTMPVGTAGFYLYAEPNPFAVHAMTVSGLGSGGGSASLGQLADGSGGAAGWAISASGESLVSVTVSMDDGITDFAIGEFGITDVPAPGALALLGLAGLAGRRRRA